MPKAQESAQREEAACFARRRARCKPSPAISMPRPSPKLKLLPCATIGDASSEFGEALALLGSHTFVEGEGTGHTSRSSPTQPVAPIEGYSDSLEGDARGGARLDSAPRSCSSCPDRRSSTGSRCPRGSGCWRTSPRTRTAPSQLALAPATGPPVLAAPERGGRAERARWY